MPAPRNPEPDPERDWVQIRREDLGMLLAASLAVLGRQIQAHPDALRTWQLAVATTAAERALLSTERAEPPGR